MLSSLAKTATTEPEWLEQHAQRKSALAESLKDVSYMSRNVAGKAWGTKERNTSQDN
jgi:hypothetical protein